MSPEQIEPKLDTVLKTVVLMNPVISLDELREAVLCLVRATEAATNAFKTFAAEVDAHGVFWAERVHPEWVKIMRRTKKCRIRKKYADRIWRAYLKEGETPSKT